MKLFNTSLLITLLFAYVTFAIPPQALRTSIGDIVACPPSLASKYSVSKDSTYGFTKENPIRTGEGPMGERQYLAKLQEALVLQIDSIIRLGSTAYEISDEKVLMIDLYQIYVNGVEYGKPLMLDMYNCSVPKIPMGLGAVK